MSDIGGGNSGFDAMFFTISAIGALLLAVTASRCATVSALSKTLRAAETARLSARTLVLGFVTFVAILPSDELQTSAAAKSKVSPRRPVVGHGPLRSAPE